MEVVAGGERAGGPFSRRNVQEWSRLDQLTGLLEHARVETDHWAKSTNNSSHHFGKVVDSRSRSLADGGKEQRHQTKQLEVFQANIPGGSVQVIRSSTSSSWQSHKTISGGSGWSENSRLALPSSESQDFDHLKLGLHPLDLSSQKTKASIGRSGSIGSRRPPSRPRSIVGSKSEEFSEFPEGSGPTDISKICQEVHEETKQKLKNYSTHEDILLNRSSYEQNDNLTNNDSLLAHFIEGKLGFSNSAINETLRSNSDSNLTNSHLGVFRKKSCSSEDLHIVDEEDNGTSTSGSNWKRSSKVRRSLQFPSKQTLSVKESIVIPVTKTVAEIKKEIETRKQLVTNSFKTNKWNDLTELEGVLGNVNSVKNDLTINDQVKDINSSENISSKSPKKRQTFITAETLQEVKGRLRKLNSPVDKTCQNDDVDDGIEAESKPQNIAEVEEELPKNSVKSYVFGMEVMLQKSKPSIIGTGSLESRSSNKSVTNCSSRSEEWYNRRKSYGFEQVSSQQNSNSYFEKSKIESSTDSGICKSSDTFPSWQKLIDKHPTNQTNTTHSIVIKPYAENGNIDATEIEGDTVIHKGRKTVVNLTSNPSVSNSSWSWCPRNLGRPISKDVSKEATDRLKISQLNHSLKDKTIKESQRLSEPITISIPIIQQVAKNSCTDPTDLLLKETKVLERKETQNSTSQNTLNPYNELIFSNDPEKPANETGSIFDNIPWRGNRTKTLSNFFDSEFKRHSIAVDQTKYLNSKRTSSSFHFSGADGFDSNKSEGSFNRELAPCYFNDKDSIKGHTDSDHEQSTHDKKQKKVEFCKTEVHFAAEPGRFNIVETDGKPPPNNMYRRRRKISSETINKSGLPEIRFGDTQYEKNMLLTTDNSHNGSGTSTQPLDLMSSLLVQKNTNEAIAQNNPTTEKTSLCKFESTSQSKDLGQSIFDVDNSSEDDNPKPRSILKNSFPKPKPYILGGLPDDTLTEDSSSWGVKLKSVKSANENSTKSEGADRPNETEFQKLLKSLRPAANKPADLCEPIQQYSTAADNGLEVRISSSALPPDHRRASWSVADRVRHVEESKGYSTKVNFGPQETTVIDSKTNESGFHTNSSDLFKSSWLIQEQFSPLDKIFADQEPNLKSIKKLTHSQSFNIPVIENPIGKIKNSDNTNMLKSTSLVLEVQNPSHVRISESEKKVSVKEISTNITRDSCGKSQSKIKVNVKDRCICSVNERINDTLQNLTTFPKGKNNALRTTDTNTIPPVRKTSSSTQTYFVNRSAIKNTSCEKNIIKSNHKEIEYLKEVNGIPGVLNALDDLSRCIDEVIIESPKKVCKQDLPAPSSVFKVREDYKGGCSSPNSIMSVVNTSSNPKSQLDLLREIVDAGDMSDDSFKADEEVRAYMSADNDDTHSSEWSGSWSRVRTLKQHFKQGLVKDDSQRISPNFKLSPMHHRHKTETAINTQVVPPCVTSISFQYEDKKQPVSSTNIKSSVDSQGALANRKSAASYISRSFLNTKTSEIPTIIELSGNGDRSWSFSKSLDKNNVTLSEVIENESLSFQNVSKNVNNKFINQENTISPSKFSRNSQSPTKESLFLERTAERNMLYNNSNRQMSSSPTCGTSKKNVSSAVIKFDNVQNSLKKNNLSTQSPNTNTRSSVKNSSMVKTREDKYEINRKNDAKKSGSEIKPKERKLSTSSSGRDSWLNTPKEAPMRKKTEQSIKKQDFKKESKRNDTFKVNGVVSSQKRTESPIYQNRDAYTDQRDSNDNTETESTILEELTKAADQILLAVNGYTDDDSYRASSEDEYRKRRERTSQPLCTISELPNKKTNSKSNKLSVGVIKSTRSTDLRREYHISSKNKLMKTPSNSSMDSSVSQDVKPLLTSEDRSKRRAARLLQRASSRELLFQTTASSSEDMGSGSDTGSIRTKRIYRRPRLQNGKHSSSKHEVSTTSISENRTKEKFVQGATSSEMHKKTRGRVETDKRCSRHSKTTGSSMGEQRERRPLTHSSRIQKKKSEASQLEAKSGGVTQE